MLGGGAGSPYLTVNRPLVLFLLPMKNRAPRTDRPAGKGTSAILKPWEGGFRATRCGGGGSVTAHLWRKGQGEAAQARYWLPGAAVTNTTHGGASTADGPQL